MSQLKVKLYSCKTCGDPSTSRLVARMNKFVPSCPQCGALMTLGGISKTSGFVNPIKASKRR